MTLKELKALAQTIMENKDDFVQKTDILTPPKKIAAMSYIQDGRPFLKNHCHVCGHEWDIETATRISPFGYVQQKCPVCGCDETTLYCFNADNTKYCFIQKNEEYTVLMLATRQWEYEVKCPTEDPFAWIRADEKVTLDAQYVIVATPNGQNAVRTNTQHFVTLRNRYVRGMLNVCRYNGKAIAYNADTGELDNDLMIQTTTELLDLPIAAKRTNSDSNNYDVADLSSEIKKRIEEETRPVLAKIVYSAGNISKFECSCKRCGKNWTFESTLSSPQIECPKCGNTRHMFTHLKYSHLHYYFFVYEGTELKNNDLLIRYVHAQTQMNEDRITATTTIEEELRWFIGKNANGKVKSKVLQKDGKDKWVSATPAAFQARWSHEICIQTAREIRDIIQHTSMAQSGLLEAYGLDDRYVKICDMNDLSYLTLYKKCPQIELLAKANIPRIAKEFVNSQTTVSTGTTAAEILGVSKAILKLTRKYDLDFYQTNMLASLLKEDPSADVEMIVNAMKHDNAYALMSAMITLSRMYGIKVKRSMEYLQSVYDHQCIEKDDAARIWIDYLRMASACHFDLTDKSRKFPASLKKEHDIAMFAYNKIKDEIDAEMFRKQAEINSVLEYQDDDFIVKVPRTPEDVIAEATAQRNCLRSYLSRIKEGSTRVVFVRKKKEPDTSYVTIEVSNDNHIVQVKGYCNSTPHGDKLNAFLAKWKSKKAIA